jgi:hypothetical protein
MAVVLLQNGRNEPIANIRQTLNQTSVLQHDNAWLLLDSRES